MLIKTTSYFHAKFLHDIAVRSAQASSADPGGTAVSIMFSAASVEAFINECGLLVESIPTDKRQEVINGLGSVLSELEGRKESLVIKYHLALLALAKKTWSKGAQPLQDLRLLLDLRNEVVHMKGDTWESEAQSTQDLKFRSIGQHPKFVQALMSRGLLGKTQPLANSWLEVISRPHVAQWACATASCVTQAFLAEVPDGCYKEKLRDLVFPKPIFAK